MKVLTFDSDACVGCYICEEVCSETWFKVKDAEKSRIRIIEEEGEEGVVLNAVLCNQCGECIEVCPTEALLRDKQGIVRLRRKICVGCLSCVGFCPYAAMFHHPDQDEPFKCIACGQCVDECPADALAIIEKD